MPDLPLTTPSLLFPAISLLMLAYTNRFLGLASVVRSLHAAWRTSGDRVLVAQIETLRKRIRLIKHMQTFGVLGLILCTASMCLIFLSQQTAGQIAFAISLVLMIGSLGLSLWEIQMSGAALDLQLRDLERPRD